MSLDSGGKLQASVARSSFWVQDGLKHNAISTRLAAAVQIGLGALNVALADKFDELASFSFSEQE